MTLAIILIAVLAVTAATLGLVVRRFSLAAKSDGEAIEHLLNTVYSLQRDNDDWQDQTWGYKAQYEYCFEELGETIDALWEARNQIRELEDMLDAIAAASDITSGVEIVDDTYRFAHLETNQHGEWELHYDTPPF